MNSLKTIFFVILAASLVSEVSAQNGERKRKYVEELDTLLVLGQNENPLKIVTSSDRSKFALAVKKGNKSFVLFDDLHRSREYDGLFNLNVSPNGLRFAFTARLGSEYWVVVDDNEMGPFSSLLSDTVVFSPDSKRFAFPAGYKFFPKREEYFMMVDGFQQERCDKISLEPPKFSHDGKRIIYFAIDDSVCVAIADGEKGPVFENTGGTPSFSYDGSLVSYYGMRNNRGYLVVNDTLIGGYYGISNPVYSPSALEIAYAVWEQKKEPWQVHINFKPVEKYFSSNHPVYSPDGSRFAFCASDGEKQFAVVDGLEDPTFDSISDVRFTEDNNHYYYIAYIRLKPKQYAFVVDGKKQVDMNGRLERYNIFFSVNGSKFAYLWQIDKNTERLIVDGNDFTAYNIDDVVFSPDESRYAFLYKESKSSEWQLFVDGNKISYGDQISPNVTFSPDNKDVAFYSWRDKKAFLVINDQVFEEFVYITPFRAEFNFDGSLVNYGIRDNYLFKISVKPER